MMVVASFITSIYFVHNINPPRVFSFSSVHRKGEMLEEGRQVQGDVLPQRKGNLQGLQRKELLLLRPCKAK